MSSLCHHWDTVDPSLTRTQPPRSARLDGFKHLVHNSLMVQAPRSARLDGFKYLVPHSFGFNHLVLVLLVPTSSCSSKHLNIITFVAA
jgi:hypothetical protein